MYHPLSGVPEVGGDIAVEAAAEGLPGGGNPEAERALPAEDAAQGDPNRAAQQRGPDRCAEACPARDAAPPGPLSECS